MIDCAAKLEMNYPWTKFTVFCGSLCQTVRDFIIFCLCLPHTETIMRWHKELSTNNARTAPGHPHQRSPFRCGGGGASILARSIFPQLDPIARYPSSYANGLGHALHSLPGVTPELLNPKTLTWVLFSKDRL